MAGELRLGRNTQATARMVVVAAVVGGALTATWGKAADALFGWHMFERLQGPWAAWATLGSIGAPILCLIVLWLRQPRGARITWDDWGVTEWDGDGVRSAIAKEKLRKQLVLTTAANIHGPNPLATAVAGAVLAQSDLPGGSIGGHVILSDEHGRRIDVTQGVQNATLNRRLSTVDALSALTSSEPVRSAPQGDAPKQPSSENLLVFGYLLGIAGYLSSCFALLMAGSTSSQPFLWVLCAGATVLLLLRSLPWWVRAGRLSRPDRGAEKMTLDGGDAARLLLRDAGGAPLDVDLVALRHPDAAIATRKGDAWVVRGKDGKVASIEAAGARQARRALALATRLEAALRTLLALLVLLPMGPLVLAALRELQGGVPGVTVVYSSSGAAVELDVKSGLAVVFTSDGPKLIDVRSGAELAALGERECWRGQAVISPGGAYVLLSCDEQAGPFTLYSNEGGAVKALGAIPIELFEPRFAFDGPTTLVVGDHIARVSVIELPSLAKVKEMPWFSFSLRGLVVSPATHEVLFAGWGSDAPSKAYRWSTEGAAAALEETHDTLGRIAISPDGKLLALQVRDGVELYALPAGTRVARLELDVRDTNALAFSPDGRTLAIASEGLGWTDPNPVRFVEVPSLKEYGARPLRWRRSTFQFENEAARKIAWTDDGQQLYAVGGGKVFRIEPPPRR